MEDTAEDNTELKEIQHGYFHVNQHRFDILYERKDSCSFLDRRQYFLLMIDLWDWINQTQVLGLLQDLSLLRGV